ncbi:MAG: hypothetical protein JEZ06_04320 [Anaerolineaceae bacterium]|nr:hypothetical protein [Anaerolineaceae bacterium]
MKKNLLNEISTFRFAKIFSVMIAINTLAAICFSSCGSRNSTQTEQMVDQDKLVSEKSGKEKDETEDLDSEASSNYVYDNSIRFTHLSVEQGLSQSSVSCIVQDHLGYIWVGTQDGLNRYDGVQFKTFKNDPGNLSSLSNNSILTMLEDYAGWLWVGTNGGGLNRLDRKTGEFERFQVNFLEEYSISGDTVNTLFQDSLGNLWIGTSGGVDRYLYDGDHIEPFSISQDNFGNVQTIFEDYLGEIWFGSERGVFRYLPDENLVKHYYHQQGKPQSLSHNSVRRIYEDSSGDLWIGTLAGLDQFDRAKEIFTTLSFKSSLPSELRDGPLEAIIEDSTGLVWFATRGLGVFSFDREHQEFVHYAHDPVDGYSLSDDTVNALFEDREGNIWIGTASGGLNVSGVGRKNFSLIKNHPGDINSLQGNMVWSVFEDRAGNLWIGTESGLNHLDRENNEFTLFEHLPYDPTSLYHNEVRVIYEDKNENLWVGTTTGLNRFIEETGSFEHYRQLPDENFSLMGNQITDIYEDRSGSLWVGTSRGLNLYQPEMDNFVQDPYNFFSQSPYGEWFIRSIMEDREGQFWVGTDRGLLRYQPADDLLSRYVFDPFDQNSLSSNRILTVYEDQKGQIWIGTSQGGLNRFDAEKELFVHYREQEGLPNDVVYGILEDDSGCLWLSTNNGLSKFNPQTEVFENFTVRDGLQSNEFNSGAFYQSRNGEMFFGGINGLNAFFPGKMVKNSYEPPIVLTDLSQSGVALLPVNWIGVPESLTFYWPNNYFEFEFAALSYSDSQQNQYAYKLDNFDDWNAIGNKRYGRYTNLPGGKYVLQLKGSNNDNVWNEEGISIPVVIVPPFWELWWIQVFAAALLIMLIAISLQRRVKSVEERSLDLEFQVDERTRELSVANERLRNEMTERERTEVELSRQATEAAVAQERNRLARDLHDAVTQTLFSASLIAEALPETWQIDQKDGLEALQDLRQLNQGALAEMRSLLMELRPSVLEETPLVDLIHQISAAASGRAGITVQVEICGDCLLPNEVQIVIYRTAQEAMNNMVKHSRAQKAGIILNCSSVSPENGVLENIKVELLVWDDGRGFEIGKCSAQGMGLKIMQERAHSVGANLEIKSQVEKGTKIKLIWENQGSCSKAIGEE